MQSISRLWFRTLVSNIYCFVSAMSGKKQNGGPVSQKVPSKQHETRETDINQNDRIAVMEIIKYFKRERHQIMAMLKESRKDFETLEMNKRAIHMEVDTVRRDINKHLDALEAKLRKNLDEIHKEAAKECQYRIAELEARQSAIQEYQRRLENVIKFWSRRQDSDLSAIQTFYESIIQHRLDTANKSYEYEFQINDKIDNLKSLIKQFGSVRLHCYVNSFDDSGVRDIQSSQLDQSLEDCTAVVANSFSICEDHNSNIGGCTYLYNGLLMIGNRLTNSLQQVSVRDTRRSEAT